MAFPAWRDDIAMIELSDQVPGNIAVMAMFAFITTFYMVYRLTRKLHPVMAGGAAHRAIMLMGIMHSAPTVDTMTTIARLNNRHMNVAGAARCNIIVAVSAKAQDLIMINPADTPVRRKSTMTSLTISRRMNMRSLLAPTRNLLVMTSIASNVAQGTVVNIA